MRVIFFGSGAFGLPTLEAILDQYEVPLVISQPDRPAGRRRQLTPTPIGAFAAERGLHTMKPEDPRDAAIVQAIREVPADAFVVVAYGHKLTPALLDDRFAINLHASLLPKYRGAAPINWAMINGEAETGVSIISLAQTMDGGLVYARAATPIDPSETAGELHDRLSLMGPEPILKTLADHAAGTLQGTRQDDLAATRAPKLSKADGVLDFTASARAVRQRIHGLTPWPGCWTELSGVRLRVWRVRDVQCTKAGVAPGEFFGDNCIACGEGAVELLEVQPPGGKVMPFAAYARGHDLRA